MKPNVQPSQVAQGIPSFLGAIDGCGKWQSGKQAKRLLNLGRRRQKRGK
jgi:hypothetical protein